jgi:hypothetical protein
MERLSKEEPAVCRNLSGTKGDGFGYEIFSKFNFWCSNCGFAADIIGIGDCTVYFCPRCGEEVDDE